MNRVVSKRVGCFIYRPELAKSAFCSLATPELSGSTHGQTSNEPQENHTFTNNTPQHDIVIVGGGMVGMALACALANTPLTKHLSVAIVDKNPALERGSIIRNENPPDPRVSTITPATMSFLKDIGAWKYVEQHRHVYFDKMQVWDYTGLGYTRYSARDAHKEVLGCVVENKVLHGALYSCTQNADSEKTIYPSRLSSLSVSPSSSSIVGGLAKLELDDNTNLFAKLVIGADGSKSHVRQLAGFETTGWNYSQSAVICTVEHSTKNGCAWQRFLPSGPIALLPMGDKFSNIVWTMNPNDSADYKLMTEEDFVKAINHALDYGYGPHPKSNLLNMGSMFSWLKADVTSSASEHFEIPPMVVKLASERMVFPLSLMHANKYASNRLALVGDAAHTVHPLAGQGVNMGFGDVAVLSKIIAEAVAVGSDVGEVSLLKKYEADRKVANITMMAILDSVQKAYSVDFGPLNVVRAAAFHGAQHISLLKQSIISYASGEGRLPLPLFP